jgi:hypothetical protein
MVTRAALYGALLYLENYPSITRPLNLLDTGEPPGQPSRVSIALHLGLHGSWGIRICCLAGEARVTSVIKKL